MLFRSVDFLESRNDVPQLLASWDGFVYSTDHDTFGIAVIEAIASGLPTFVNDWEVMKEVTEDGNLAWLYPTGNAEALCELLCRFITSPSDYQQKALKAAEKVREKFSIQQHANELYQQYQKQLEA